MYCCALCYDRAGSGIGQAYRAETELCVLMYGSYGHAWQIRAVNNVQTTCYEADARGRQEVTFTRFLASDLEQSSGCALSHDRLQQQVRQRQNHQKIKEALAAGGQAGHVG